MEHNPARFFRILILITCISLQFTCSNTGEATSTPSADSTVVVNARIVLEEVSDVQISSGLYGYNTANLFTHLDIENDDWKELGDGLPAVLRFPGGTLANFYHFDSPGYGYRAEDKQAVGGKAIENFERSLSMDRSLIQRKGLSENHAHQMAELANRTGSSVLLVANLLTSSDDEIMRMVEFFKSESVRISGMELGNEYYWSGAYSSTFPDGESYVSRMEGLVQRMRLEHPEIPLGVVIAPLSSMKKLNTKKEAFNASWNQAIIEFSDFDAIIAHLYSKNNACDGLSVQEEKCRCYADYSAQYNGHQMELAMLDLESRFPSKEIWITEWNIKGVFKGLGNTMAQAIHYADFSLMTHRHHAVTISTYHNLLAKGNGFNAFGSKSDGSVTKQATALIAELFKSFDDSTMLMESSITDGGDGIRAQAYQGDGIHLIVVNSRAEAVMMNIEGREWNNAEVNSRVAPTYASGPGQILSKYSQHEHGPLVLDGVGVHHIKLTAE